MPNYLNLSQININNYILTENNIIQKIINLKTVYLQIIIINFTQMLNIVLFGKPGAGKGTQAEFLKTKYNLTHLSTGDIFRHNINNETDLGKLAKTFIDKGNLVPDQVTTKMLIDAVESTTNTDGFLFDGYPRTLSQSIALDEYFNSKNDKITATIALEADDEILVKRLLERGKTSGRPDDQDEAKIRNRYTEYNTKTAPLIEYYQKQSKFHAVDGIGTIEEITERLSKTIERLK